MHQQTKCTATGFVIAPLGSRRILTNAHAVANQVAVKVRKHGSAQRYTARVLAVGHEVGTMSRFDVHYVVLHNTATWSVDVQPAFSVSETVSCNMIELVSYPHLSFALVFCSVTLQ